MTVLAQETGEMQGADASIATLQRDIDKTYEGFIAEQTQKSGDALRQADSYWQRMLKAQARIEHMVIRAPLSGSIQSNQVLSTGQVLVAGDEILRIVPDGALEIEAYLKNEDVGFVHAGQSAKIKIEAFPFTRYGTITAEVVRVAHDAIPEPDAATSEAMRSAKPATPGGGQHMQDLVFPVTLRAQTDHLMVGEQKVALSPGMAVAAEIATGRRRVIDYILSPLAEVVGSSMSER